MIRSKAAYTLLGGIVLIAPSSITGKTIVLENMKKFDGTFFTADTIEVLRKYQRLLHSILYGPMQNDQSHTGKYWYKNKPYGSHQLAKIERQLEQEKDMLDEPTYAAEQATLQALWNEVITDFEHISEEFKPIIRETKHIMAALIKDSCAQRERTDSLLLMWTSAPQNQEVETLRREARTLIKFDQFCMDLLNFFGDMIRSCPIAKNNFETRVAKWKNVRQAVEALKAQGRVFNESSFLKYIKQSVLDTLSIDAITTEKITTLLQSFEQ
jgi:hypothetical protein